MRLPEKDEMDSAAMTLRLVVTDGGLIIDGSTK